MVASEQHLYQTIVLPRKLATGSIHDYLFCNCPLVGILFKVLRIEDDIDNIYGDAPGEPSCEVSCTKSDICHDVCEYF